MISAPLSVVRKSFPTASTLFFIAAAFLAAASPPAAAQNAVSGSAPEMSGDAPEGLWLTTPYPEFSAQAGEPIDVDLSLVNRGLPPQRVELAASGLPEGWKWEMDGGGRRVGAAIAPTGETVDLTLSLTPPSDAPKETYDFMVSGEADGRSLELPMALTLTETEPARLTLEPELPALRGTVRSTFDFQVTAKNEGQEDTVVNLLSQAPAGFQVTFTESYGSQELTSLPLEAGQSKDLKVSVEPPDGAKAGQYPVMIAASGDDATVEQKLVLDITGQAELALSGPGGRLSGDATAGEQSTYTFTLENTGTAPARQVDLSASPPSDWEVTFSPEQVAEIPAGETAEVSVAMTPSDNAIAGDYAVSINARGDGASDSANFRVTVGTSTMWGVAGLGVIAAAVVVLGFGVSRYGRR